MTHWNITRRISLTIPEEILVEIDEAAKAIFTYRSEYIRKVLYKEVERLRAQSHYEEPIKIKDLYHIDDS